MMELIKSEMERTIIIQIDKTKQKKKEIGKLVRVDTVAAVLG